jgi:hypothetical protein
MARASIKPDGLGAPGLEPGTPAGHITFSEKGPGYFLIVVIGGTGSYAGVGGFVKVRDIGGFKSSIEFHLLP